MAEMKICSKCGAEKPLINFRAVERYAGGHICWCPSCVNSGRRGRYKKNPEKFQKSSLLWYWAHAETVRARNRKWCRDHRVDRKMYWHQWYAKHAEQVKENARARAKMYPDKFREHNRKRRARKNLAEGSFTEKEWRILCDSYGNKCLACHCTDVPLTRDHVIPIGPPYFGTNYIWNIQPLCRSCNAKKKKRIDDYRFDHRFERAV